MFVSSTQRVSFLFDKHFENKSDPTSTNSKVKYNIHTFLHVEQTIILTLEVSWYCLSIF